MMREPRGPAIQELIGQKKWREIKKTISLYPAPDIADLWESLDEQDMFIVFRLLPKQLAADVFNELEPNRQISLLEQMRSAHVRTIISELTPDERTDLFEELPGQMTQKLLNLLPPEIRKESLKLLGYPKDSIGRLMTPHYVAIRPQWTIEQALEHIRQYGHNAETIDMIYVVDAKWHLLDDMPLKRLILADPQQDMESIMDRRSVSVLASEDQEKAIEVTRRYNLVALPVVDSENVLLGIVTVDDILDVVEDEVTEDVYRAAGIAATKEDLLLRGSIVTATRLRLPWLIICLVGGLAAAGVVGIFEEAIAAVVALVAFIPVIMDMGGNIGTQSSTITIRGLATGSIDIKDSLRLLWRELRLGLFMGVICGIVVGMSAQILKGEPYLGIVVGTAMVATIVVAAVLGAILPFLFRHIGVDPAVASGPAITTIKDITGLLIYFGVATWIMGI